MITNRNSIVFLLLAITTALPRISTAQTMVDPSQFRAPQEDVFTLDEGDTLGIFVEGVVGEFGSSPPVHQPAINSDLPPAIGFATLILHDGTIRLPLVEAIPVRGLTIIQVEALLKKIYRGGDNPIITDRSRVLVSLIRKRTVNVLVVRGDQSQARSAARFGQRSSSRPVSARSDGSGQIYNLNLPAGDNDLLNAMVESGGFPGVNAQDQLQVFRQFKNGRTRTSPFPRTGQSQQSIGFSQSFPVRTAGTRRSPFPRSQTRLGDGDIVSISAKPTEVFYTGGLLGGGEFPISRDRPLSITDAIAQAGGIPQSRRGVGVVPLQEPQSLTLLRQVNGQQVSRRFDLNNGFSQAASQTRVRSGDYLILDFSRSQRVQNVGIGVFNTFGVRQLFRN